MRSFFFYLDWSKEKQEWLVLIQWEITGKLEPDFRTDGMNDMSFISLKTCSLCVMWKVLQGLTTVIVSARLASMQNILLQSQNACSRPMTFEGPNTLAHKCQLSRNWKGLRKSETGCLIMSRGFLRSCSDHTELLLLGKLFVSSSALRPFHMLFLIGSNSLFQFFASQNVLNCFQKKPRGTE